MFISHNKDENMYFAVNDKGERTGELYYTIPSDNVRDIFHTKVFEQFEGQGVGKELVLEVLKDAQKENIKIVPRCPFVASYIEKHPEFKDLIN